jgi:hypothetical protein
MLMAGLTFCQWNLATTRGKEKNTIIPLAVEEHMEYMIGEQIAK